MQTVSLGDVNHQHLVDEICRNFAKNELIASYLSLSPLEIKVFTSPVINKSIKHNFALCLIDEQKFPAVSVTNLPYLQYLQTEPPVQCPKKFQPLFEVFDALAEGFTPKNPEKTIYSFTWCTRQDYTRRGLFQRILEESIAKAREEGYEQIMADCMSTASQGVARKLGFHPVSQVNYKTFKMKDGNYPFVDLDQQQTGKRMYRKI